MIAPITTRSRLAALGLLVTDNAEGLTITCRRCNATWWYAARSRPATTAELPDVVGHAEKCARRRREEPGA